MKRVGLLMVVMALGSVNALAQDVVRFVPAAASAAGANDSFFVTDLRLFNPDPEETIAIHLAWLARDADNTDAEEIEIEVGPRRGVALDDVVFSLFGITGAGGIRLRSSNPFFATSRTYNQGGDSGTLVSSSPDHHRTRRWPTGFSCRSSTTPQIQVSGPMWASPTPTTSQWS